MFCSVSYPRPYFCHWFLTGNLAALEPSVASSSNSSVQFKFEAELNAPQYENSWTELNAPLSAIELNWTELNERQFI